MKKKKYYETTITFVVISAEPIKDPEDIDAVVYETTEGCMSGKVVKHKQKILNYKQLVKAMKIQGSDPEFFDEEEDDCL